LRVSLTCRSGNSGLATVQDDNLLWFEEPCQWQTDRRAMRHVHFAGGVAVCAHQSELSAAGCRHGNRPGLGWESNLNYITKYRVSQRVSGKKLRANRSPQ
jgi:hypothetical protein